MSDCKHENKTYSFGYQSEITETCSDCNAELRSFDGLGVPESVNWILSQDQLRRMLDICLEPKT